jgi:hypothetical protein
MPKLPKFDPPAYQNDFQSSEQVQEKAFRDRWNDNMNRFTEQTLENDPWSSTNQPRLTQYYNPLTTDIPTGAKGAAIQWTAFPNRILINYPNVGQSTQWKYADEGPPAVDNYGPGGPRGWQDEYAEWSVTRNAEGKIIKVMFTCENREYWYTLWETDPNVVLRHYQQLVGLQVKLEDLYLRDNNGNPVIDPATDRPAYDDRNQWNSTTTQGAVHLISNPNALSAEIFLAGQGTVLRKDGSGNPITDKNQLINCSRYGTPNRNSDPTIGAIVNSLVRGAGGLDTGVQISLENPVGLYIQTPSFDTYQLPLSAPADAQPEDFWRIVRGRKRQDGEPIDYILHAVYEVPAELGFTVSDITIDGFNIDYGAQISQTFQIALAGLPLAAINPPAEFACAGSPLELLPRASALMDLDMLSVAFRSNLNMRIEPGTTVKNVALYTAASDENVKIEFIEGTGITIEKTDFQSQGVAEQLFLLKITVAADAPLGDRSLLLTNPDGAKGPAIYGMLEIVAPGTLARPVQPPATLQAISDRKAILSTPLTTTYSRSRNLAP